MTFSVVQIIFLVLDFLLISLFVFSIVKSWQYRPKLSLIFRRPRKMPTLKSEVFKEHWQSILSKLESADPESMKIAIIEADALIGDVLRQLGYEGEHLADRLARVRAEDFPSVEKLWQAHRLRNELVHTPSFQISQSHAQDMVEVYGKFLKEVGIL